MSKHTPGPWIYSAWDGWKSVGNSKEFLLHNGRIFFPHNPADWHLIAAAPDMLEACRAALSALDRMMGDSDLPDDDSPEMRACNLLSGVIAKATGGTE